MQNELVEHSKHCASPLCRSFVSMFKCIDDCCHLEVAQTTLSLQSSLFLKSFQQWQNTHSNSNCLIHFIDLMQPEGSSVMLHNAYNAKEKEKEKRCIPVGLYRLLCLKARGAVNCSVARVSQPDCCTVRHLKSKEKPTDVFTLQSVSNSC